MTDLTALDADLQRFWASVERTATCWLWQGARTGSGYGAFMTRNADGSRRYWSAHRFAYEAEVGTVPEEMFLLHSCDTPRCVNPAHLRPGTQKENIADAMERGRWKRPPLQADVRGDSFKVQAQDVPVIREMYGAKWAVKDIAAVFEVSPSYISNILAGRKRWQE